MDQSAILTLVPDWLVPVESPPIFRGYLVLNQGRIEFVGNDLPAKFNPIRQHSFPNVAILPGLINSHCHLEFSDLTAPIPVGESFPNWIENVIDHRTALRGTPEQLAKNRQSAIEQGIEESYAAGVRWIIDMTTSPWNPDWIDSAIANLSTEARFFNPAFENVPIVVQPCFEIIDITRQRMEQTLGFANEQFSAPEGNARGHTGFAPHAPYTASIFITQHCIEKSKQEKRIVSMHIAESIDELKWLTEHSGAFSKLLSPIMDRNYFKSLGNIEQHLQGLSQAWRALVVHGNYLSTHELETLAQHSMSMAIVHCPRTHHYFGHQHPATNRYPLAERLKAGVQHLLGTDSRASNPDINIWREAQFVRSNHPNVSSHQILRMITTDAAGMLALSDRYGALQNGRPASLTAIQMGESRSTRDDANKLYDTILANETRAYPLESLISQIANSTHFTSK